MAALGSGAAPDDFRSGVSFHRPDLHTALESAIVLYWTAFAGHLIMAAETATMAPSKITRGDPADAKKASTKSVRI